MKQFNSGHRKTISTNYKTLDFTLDIATVCFLLHLAFSAADEG